MIFVYLLWTQKYHAYENRSETGGHRFGAPALVGVWSQPLYNLRYR